MSVVIPAYNAGRYISRAIDSILAQTRKAHEIIVVDDGSTDDTKAVLQPYADRARYVRQENAGECVARNTGIRMATGRWIAFLDADDEWLPRHLSAQTALLHRNPNLVWSTGNYYCLAADRRAAATSAATTARVLAGRDYLEDFLAAYLRGVSGCTDTMVIRKDILEEVGLFHPGQRRGGDLDMWFRMAYRWPAIGYVAEPLAIYYVDIPASALARYRSPQHYNPAAFVDRHLALSEAAGKTEAFRPCAAALVRQNIRSYLFTDCGDGAQRLLAHFENLLPWHYRLAMGLLAKHPRSTGRLLRTISWLLRLLHLTDEVRPLT